MLKKCGYCGKEFEGNKTAVKFCSNECRFAQQEIYKQRKEAKRRASIPLRKCICCGKQFKGPRKKYCSEECKQKNTPKPEIIGTCLVCGKQFQKTGRQLYCTAKCRLQDYRRPEQEMIFDNPISRPTTDPKRIIEIEKQARELGISYGELQAHKYAGDLEEFLKSRETSVSDVKNVYKSSLGSKGRIKKKWSNTDAQDSN